MSSYYTAKYIREMLDGTPDDEPVFGFLQLRENQEIVFVGEDGEESSRIPTPEEWAKIVAKAEDYATPLGWESLWECLNDAKSEIVPDEEWS